MIASGHLDGVDHILEIGGALSPIDQFLYPTSSDSRTCTVLDPTIKEGFFYMPCGTKVLHKQTTFQEFDFQLLLQSMDKRDTFGVVMMGLELQHAPGELQLFDPIIRRADVLIMDHVFDNRHGAHQSFYFEEMAIKHDKHRAVELSMTFKYDSLYRKEDIVPSFHKKRCFVVYHSKDRLEN